MCEHDWDIDSFTQQVAEQAVNKFLNKQVTVTYGRFKDRYATLVGCMFDDRNDWLLVLRIENDLWVHTVHFSAVNEIKEMLYSNKEMGE